MFQHVAVFLEQQAEELPYVVRDQINLQALADFRDFDRLAARIEAGNFARRQDVNAAQVVVGIRRREAVKMRAADRGEEQRIRLRRDFIVDFRVDVHFSKLTIALLALIKNAFARS